MNKEHPFEKEKSYCGFCKYLRSALYSGDPAIACDSMDGYDYNCILPKGNRTACANAALAEKRYNAMVEKNADKKYEPIIIDIRDFII